MKRRAFNLLSLADKLVHSLRKNYLSLGDNLVLSTMAKGEHRRQQLAATIRAQLHKMKVALQHLLLDMHEVIAHTTKLKRKDDALLSQWSEQLYGYNGPLAGYLGGPKPQRIVPPHVFAMSQKMKDEFQTWDEQAATLASCMKDLNETCDDEYLAKQFDDMQHNFYQADTDWTDYKGKLCNYHGWFGICKTENMLMELGAMDKLSRDAYLKRSFCIMAFVGVAFGAALSRRRMQNPGNEQYQALLS